MRTRRNVVTLIAKEKTEWPDALVSYRKGVAAMRAFDPKDTHPPTRPDDKRSWQYLAAVHGRAVDGEFGPPDETGLWSKCQHGSWFFFPWHRMYLLTLESFIQHHSQDADWSVPYWYAIDPDTPNSDVLPKAFRGSTEGNALYIEQRSMAAQTGKPVFGHDLHKFYSDRFFDILKLQYFSADLAHPTPGYGYAYGGAEFKDQNFDHQKNGALESVPHGVTHNHVGTDYDAHGTPIPPYPYGFMAELVTAARDPIFWLHHANIDRLWQMWLDLDPAHKNPDNDHWLNSSFTFPTPDGHTKTWRIGEVLDTTAPELGYVYDTVAPPKKLAAAAASAGIRPREVGPQVSAPTPPQRPQVIGATTGVPIVADHRADIALSAPAVHSRGLAAGAGPPQPQHWLLSVEGITGTIAAPAYSVYVNLPPGALPSDHSDLLAGVITTFGVRDASRPGGEHSGSGLTFVFDITEVHEALEASSSWDPDNIQVTFVPLVPPVTDEAASAERRAAGPPLRQDLRAARVAVLVA